MIDQKQNNNQNIIENLPTKVFLSRISKMILVPVVVIALLLIYFAGAPFGSFSKPLMIEINSGDSLKTISAELKSSGVIRSVDLLRFMVSVYGGQNNIKAGVYEFDEPISVFKATYRLSHQDYGYTPVKLTFPEGINSKEILNIIDSKFPDLKNSPNYETDKAIVISKEGYLFPDTYFFPPNADIKAIVERMSAEYQNKIKKYQTAIAQSGHTEAEIITMASILEEEVKSPEDRKLVADLLWRRIANGMALQVDSTLGYINGKKSADLTQSDLATDSLYNTYKNKGLPPSPISNPGLDAIEAAISPTHNDFMFFLTGNDGKTYFSKTYAEHLNFKRLYIR
ncbi:MAG: endolytic transglycosylase MltG [bacterium]